MSVPLLFSPIVLSIHHNSLIFQFKPISRFHNEFEIENNMQKCKVTKSDLKAKLREANVIHLSEVKAVVFESTGDISVLHGSDDKDIDDWIIDF